MTKKQILSPVILLIAIVALSSNTSQACFLPRDQASLILGRLLNNYPMDSLQPGFGNRYGMNGQNGYGQQPGLGNQYGNQGGGLYGQGNGLYGNNRLPLNNQLQNGGLPLNNGQMPYNNQYSLNNPNGR